jgi:hypothetical protein
MHLNADFAESESSPCSVSRICIEGHVLACTEVATVNDRSGKAANEVSAAYE